MEQPASTVPEQEEEEHEKTLVELLSLMDDFHPLVKVTIN